MQRDPQRGGRPVDAFVRRFDAHVPAVPACRRAFVEWMRGAGVEGGTVDDLEVVFSELATNAVTASPSTTDEVRVDARLDDVVLFLEVSNRTARPGQVPTPVTDEQDTLRERGRGLVIARALMDSVRMETQLPDRFIVRCDRRLARR